MYLGVGQRSTLRTWEIKKVGQRPTLQLTYFEDQ